MGGQAPRNRGAVPDDGREPADQPGALRPRLPHPLHEPDARHDLRARMCKRTRRMSWWACAAPSCGRRRSGPLYEHTERAIATGERQSYELATKMPNRGPSVREWTVVPLVGQSGKVERILTMSIDVTAQRRMLEPSCARRISARASSSPCCRTSCATRWRRSGRACTCWSTARRAARRQVGAQRIIDRQVDQLVRLVDDLLDVTRIAQNRIQLQRSGWT